MLAGALGPIVGLVILAVGSPSAPSRRHMSCAAGGGGGGGEAVGFRSSSGISAADFRSETQSETTARKGRKRTGMPEGATATNTSHKKTILCGACSKLLSIKCRVNDKRHRPAQKHCCPSTQRDPSSLSRVHRRRHRYKARRPCCTLRTPAAESGTAPPRRGGFASHHTFPPLHSSGKVMTLPGSLNPTFYIRGQEKSVLRV